MAPLVAMQGTIAPFEFPPAMGTVDPHQRYTGVVAVRVLKIFDQLLDITERAEGLVPLTIHLLVIARNRHHPQDGDAFFRPILEVRHRAEPCCFNPEIP